MMLYIMLLLYNMGTTILQIIYFYIQHIRKGVKAFLECCVLIFLITITKSHLVLKLVVLGLRGTCYRFHEARLHVNREKPADPAQLHRFPSSPAFTCIEKKTQERI